MQLRAFALSSTFTVLLAAPALGSTSAVLKEIDRYAGEVIQQSYIVKLKDGVSKAGHLEWLTSISDPTCNITHGEWEPSVLNGFGGA